MQQNQAQYPQNQSPHGSYPSLQSQYPPSQDNNPQGQYSSLQGQNSYPQGQYPPPQQEQYTPTQGQNTPQQGQYPPPQQGQNPPPQQGQYTPIQGQNTPQYAQQGQGQYPPQGQQQQDQQFVQPPFEVTIGITNLPCPQYFDDLNLLSKYPQPHKIKKIIVQYNNDHVFGVKFEYLAGPQGISVKGERSTGFKLLKTLFTSLTKDDFKVADDDYIKEVFGYADNVIHQIGFQTYKGHRKTFGVAKGIYFSYSFAQHTFSAARGSYGRNELFFLCLKVVKLPDVFVQKMAFGQQIIVEQQGIQHQPAMIQNTQPQVIVVQGQQQQPKSNHLLNIVGGIIIADKLSHLGHHHHEHHHHGHHHHGHHHHGNLHFR